jgi:hypothetical protein
MLQIGNVKCVVLGTDAHILRPSKSSFGMFITGVRHSYCCQDGCCDRGLRPDVQQLIQQAKEEHGATRVILRTGQNYYYVREIAGLPVCDVADHTGVIDDTHEVRRW